MTAPSWQVERSRSTAGEFHARAIPDPAIPLVWVHDVTTPALVLGSTQRDDVVDDEACRRAGVDVVRRRSGGGAVWLAPDEVVWVDVVLPAGHVGWADDVHAPMVWLGERLALTFERLGVGDLVVHRGRMETTPNSRLVCFDGLGPGEVVQRGAKLVGMSQRRTREAARLQCCWYVRHDHRDLTSLLTVDVAPGDLRPVATVERDVAAAVASQLATSLA